MRRRPAQEKAIGYLSSVLSRYRAEGRERLPTIEQMAREARVSKVVMGNTVALFVQTGHLIPRQGKGILIATMGTNSRKQPNIPVYTANDEKNERHERQKWYTVANQIGKDIANGLYPFSIPLPSHKELAAHYGISSRTLQKSLTFLLKKNVIISRNRRLFPEEIDRIKTRLSVLVLLRKELPSVVAPVYLLLQQYCSEIGCNVKLIPYDMGDSERLTRIDDIQSDMPTFDEVENSLGVIMFMTGLGLLDQSRIVHYILSYDKPIAVLDETGAFKMRKVITSPYLLRSFALRYTSRCGYDVGRFLISQNHCDIIYISPYHRNLWSQNRFLGLTVAIKEINKDAVITPVVIDKLPETDVDWNRITSVLSYLKDNENEFVDVNLSDALIENRIIIIINDVITKKILQMNLHSLFEQALQKENVTAWVCANDIVALEALKYLRDKDIDIPRDISVIGFDDTIEAQMEQLTSYNFGVDKIVKAMLYHITRPKEWNWTPDSANAPVEIGGFLVCRATT